MGDLRGLCFQDTPWSTIGKIYLYICRLFLHNVVSLNNKMAAMLVSHNLAGNKTFCHVNTSFCPNWFERVVKTLAIHPKIRCNCTTVQSVCPCKPNECESSHICRYKNGTKNAIMSQSDVCHSCQSQLTAVKMGHLLTCITWWYCLLRPTIHKGHDMNHRGGFKKRLVYSGKCT